MKQESVRTTIEIPEPMYRQLKKEATARGESVRQLILAGVRGVSIGPPKPRSRKVRFPLIVSRGPKVAVTNEQIYELVEFP